MRIILLLLLALFVAISVWFFQTNPGTLLITLPHWSVETPLWLSLVAVLVTFLVLHYVILVMAWLKNFKSRFRKRKSDKNVRKSLRLTKQGLSKLIEHDWDSAEKYFNQVVKIDKGYLEAKLLAFQAKMKNKSDIDCAEIGGDAKTQEEKNLVALFKADCYAQQNRDELALEILNHLPTSPLVIKKRYYSYLALKDFDALYQIMPQIKRFKILDEKALSLLEEKIYIHQIERSSNDFSQLIKIWDDFPRAIKKRACVFSRFADAAINLGHSEAVEKQLTRLLAVEKEAGLIKAWGNLKPRDPKKALKIGEKWLEEAPKNSDLLFALSKQAIAMKLWGKAENYLKEAIDMYPTKPFYQTLYRLYQNQGNQRRADEVCRQFLEVNSY